jgi:histidinol-phosphate/aromatic aminotransferase/cobyric acid decarboxylase-like protein
VNLKPFEDKQEVENIVKERERLIESLSDFDIPDSEKRFLIRKINNISEKLLKKAQYKKDS